MAVRTLEPLMAARPSRASKVMTGMPALSIAALPGIRSPSKKASPSPISTRAIWAMGERSPQAPTEPLSYMTGVTPRLSISMKVWVSTGRWPEWPWQWTLMREAMAPRETSSGSGSPSPAAWE
jgi:hypothetical protein